MKNLNFIDPEVAEEVVFKQEILNDLRERLFLKGTTEINEWLDWFDSITNEVALTPDEASNIVSLLEIAVDYKPDFLFKRIFFPDVQDDVDLFNQFYLDRQDDAEPHTDFTFIPSWETSNTELLNRFYRTELFNDERIKSIPLLFKKIGDKETFYPHVMQIIKEIKAHCAQNEEFAKAYQAKLAELRNNNGSLQERLALYVDNYGASQEALLGPFSDLLHELEQPAFEIFREYFNTGAFYRYSEFEPLFVSLLQTSNGMQIPRWNEKNYLCRFLLDYEIIYGWGILDKLFRDYTTADVVLTICNHLKWRNDNMPQYQINHRGEYAKFLGTQLPEWFSGDIPQKYLDLLYDRFFGSDQYCDRVQSRALAFINNYLTDKIASAIIENNHGQILEISHLLDNENDDWIEKLVWNGGNKGHLWQLQPRISSAMNFFKNGDHVKKWRNILKASKNDFYFMMLLRSSLVKNQRNKNPSLTLEDFVQQYIPLEIFPEIFNFNFFQELQELNRDEYQSMMKQHPELSRKDALLDRLLSCFAAIAIKNTDEMLIMLNYWAGIQCDPDHFYYSNERIYASVVQLFLYILEQLCEKYEEEHELITLIFEIIFRDHYCIPAMFDIIKKYPQVQQLVIEHCYTILNGSWDTPICTPLSSHQIQAGIPARIIGMYKGPWHGLKPLLIALRKTRVEWINASLGINRDCHPNGNSNLVEEIKLYFDFCRESSLKSLRQDMTNGLSDWLKPLPESKRGNLEKRLTEFPEIEKDREGFDIAYTEPDPIWRYAYVRAIADLGVDVDGKGHYIHSVMDMVAKKDPSEMVRKVAEKASAKLKKLRNGWDGDKHYQKITLSFWWIKQASRLALNLPIDDRKSLKTRSYDGDKNIAIENERERIKALLDKPIRN